MTADERQKRDAWNVALGIMKIDVEPSVEFLVEVEKEIHGELTTEVMLSNWDSAINEGIKGQPLGTVAAFERSSAYEKSSSHDLP